MPNMTEDVTYHTEKNIAYITFNRPQKKNALTTEMYAAWAHYLSQAEQSVEISVVVLQGAGKHFTSGNDLNEFLNNPPTDTSSPVFQVMTALATAQKIMIAKVQGVAIGIGMTMLLHCDLVFADEDATLQMPFVPLGLCPEAGASLLLPALVGQQRAKELLLFGHGISAKDAYRLGIINTVYPSADFAQQSQQQITQISQHPKHALLVTKKLLRHHIPQEKVLQAIGQESADFLTCLKHPETQQRIQAFFTGKH